MLQTSQLWVARTVAGHNDLEPKRTIALVSHAEDVHWDSNVLLSGRAIGNGDRSWWSCEDAAHRKGTDDCESSSRDGAWFDGPSISQDRLLTAG